MKKRANKKGLNLYSALESESLLNMVDEIMEKGEDYCIGCIAYKQFEKPLQYLLKRTVHSYMVFFEIFLVFLTLSVGASLIAKQPVALLGVLIVVLLISSGGIWIIKVGYKLLVPVALKYAIELPASDQDKRKMLQWIAESFDVRKQILATVIFSPILIASFIFVDIVDNSLPVSISSYVAVILGSISVSQGLYWAIRIPNYGSTLSQLKSNLFPLEPSQSPSVLALTDAINKSTSLASVFFGLSLIALFWTLSYASVVNIFLIILYIAGLLIISIFFFYSMSLVSKLISNAKRQTLMDFQNQIQARLSNIGDLSKEDFIFIDEIMKLYEQVKKTSDSAINVKAMFSYVGAIILQSVPVIVQLIDFPQLLLWLKSFVN